MPANYETVTELRRTLTVYVGTKKAGFL